MLPSVLPSAGMRSGCLLDPIPSSCCGGTQARHKLPPFTIGRLSDAHQGPPQNDRWLCVTAAFGCVKVGIPHPSLLVCQSSVHCLDSNLPLTNSDMVKVKGIVFKEVCNLSVCFLLSMTSTGCPNTSTPAGVRSNLPRPLMLTLTIKV